MIRFLVNPSSGGGRGRRSLDRLRPLAERAGADLEVSHDAAHLTARAAAAVEEGVERLVVAGGDGTFHHVLQSLAGAECVLGLVPVGRGNDLASTLGVPREVEAAVEVAVGGAVRPIDLGLVAGRYFACYCGVGFDSEVASWVHARKRRLNGPAVYALGVVRTLFRFVPPAMQVEHDGGRFEGKAMFSVVSNTPRFGGGMQIAPEALVDDGMLDLVVVEEVTKPALLRVFPKVYRGRHVGHPAISIEPTRRARIGVDRTMRLYADGEPVLDLGQEPVDVAVRPAALRVAVP